jgi:hypothetical protein
MYARSIKNAFQWPFQPFFARLVDANWPPENGHLWIAEILGRMNLEPPACESDI